MMDNLSTSTAGLLPEMSRLSQTNSAANKVDLIPSHYPPPPPPKKRIVAEEDKNLCASETKDGKLVVLAPPNVSMCVDLGHLSLSEMSLESTNGTPLPSPPPLPPREPAVGGHLMAHRPVPPPVCIMMGKNMKKTTMSNELPVSHVVLHHERSFLDPHLNDIIGSSNSSALPHNSLNHFRFCSDCDFFGSSVIDDRVDPTTILINPPTVHHHRATKPIRDDNNLTHHTWNALHAKMSVAQGHVGQPVLTRNDAEQQLHSDGQMKLTTSNLQTTVLNQVIPLSRWPIGTRQPEIHFALDRIVTKQQAGNEYVDSPHTSHKDIVSDDRSAIDVTRAEGTTSRDRDGLSIIATQPASIYNEGKSNDNKNNRSVGGKTSKEDDDFQRHEPCKEGLICSRCGKCRCLSCTQPRPLPRCWIGRASNQCECSVQQIVNFCSCVCCVQALFYHCLYHQDDEDDIATEPCACCERPRCCLRWTIMGLLLPFIPCLCLYCPLQCAVDVCTSCYNGCSRRGCHCGRDVSSSGSSATRDLLLDSEPSST